MQWFGSFENEAVPLMSDNNKLGADFGSRLRLLRLDRRLTITDLARAANLTPAAVWQWENRGKIPRSGSLRAAAKALGVDPTFFQERPPRARQKEIRLTNAEEPNLEELMRAIEAKGFSVEVKPRGKR